MRRKQPAINRDCAICGKTYHVRSNLIDTSNYCSNACKAAARKGKPAPNTIPTLEQRFLAKFSVGDGCWEWTGWRDAEGYGRMETFGHVILVHRMSWTMFRGEIPEGMDVLHSCDNRACVRPDHLFLGTQRDNNNDKVAKGRNRVCLGDEHYFAKLTWEQVDEMRARFETGNERIAHLAREYGVSRGIVGSIVHYQSWRKKTWGNNSL